MSDKLFVGWKFLLHTRNPWPLQHFVTNSCYDMVSTAVVEAQTCIKCDGIKVSYGMQNSTKTGLYLLALWTKQFSRVGMLKKVIEHNAKSIAVDT